MGLGNFTDTDYSEDDSDESSKQSKSNSSDDGGLKERSLPSGSYYAKKHRYPYMTIEEDDGELVSHIHPYTTPVVYVKEDKDSDWEQLELPDCMVKVWWDTMEFKNHAHKVRNVLDKEFSRLLRDDPTEAIQALKEAKRKTPKPEKPSQTRTCYVCGKEHNNLSGEYKKFGNYIACMSHTIEEINEAGLL